MVYLFSALHLNEYAFSERHLPQLEYTSENRGDSYTSKNQEGYQIRESQINTILNI